MIRSIAEEQSAASEQLRRNIESISAVKSQTTEGETQGVSY